MASTRRGSLMVVGSGIKSVGHLTLEAKGWIEQSDIVLYCVADPATDTWIQAHARAHFDLYSLYGNDKKRIDTYNDMTQAMLDNVRAGRDTCAVFYGHPGVFVLPTHKAISILRKEGYSAGMLPAISALDCLWADVGVDPSTVGCQEYEATDMLLRRRPLLSDLHVVIWQIGCVGDAGFNFAGYDNRNLDILVDYLVASYGPHHEVVHYQGSQYPMCASRCDRMPLEAVRTAPVTGISTLYIPPLGARATDMEMAVRLGLARPGAAGAPARHATNGAPARAEAKTPPLGARASRATPLPAREPYSPIGAPVNGAPAPVNGAAAPAPVAANAARAPATRAHDDELANTTRAARTPETNANEAARQLALSVERAAAAARREAALRTELTQKRRTGPYAQYVPARGGNRLALYIARMMEDPRVLAEFMRDPAGAAAVSDLSPSEREALVSMHPGRIRMAMKEAPRTQVEPAPSLVGARR